MPENLSVCIIAKNEEKFLPDCLESVKPVAGEIVLVDTGSEDSTISIASKYGCRIIRFPWRDDFSLARNIAVENARFPFILSIDADERLTNPDILSSALRNATDNTGGWLVRVISEAIRQDGGVDTFVSVLLRLFRNHPQIRFKGIIHEQIVESVLNAGYKLTNTDISFLHVGYSHNPDAMNKKQLRNLDLLNKAISISPKDGYSLFQRAKTYFALKDLAQAELDIASALILLDNGGAVKPQALNYGAIIAFHRGELQQAEDRAQKSLNLIPRQSFANFILGEVFYSKRNFSRSNDYYLEMENAQQSPDLNAFISGEYNMPPEQAAFKIGRNYIALNQLNKAEDYFAKGNYSNPKDIACIVGLANIAFSKKELNKAKKLLLEALDIEPERPDIREFIKQVDSAILTGSERSVFIQEENNMRKERMTSSGKPLLSLAMIVKNEEDYLPGCLESVKNCVDEIIIIDTGSVDKTKEIARSYGAKIYDYNWNNDFSAARNESLKKCTGEWILYLDADERLKPDSVQKIQKMLESTGGETGGFVCHIESDHVQLDGSTEMHHGGYPRIFRNYGYPNIKFEGRVHEQITPSIFALNKSVEFSDIVISHLGYNKSREQMEQKVKRNYTLLMEHIKEEPLNGYAWFQLGQTLGHMHLFNESEKAIRFAIEVGKLSPSVYASAASTLSQLTGNQKKFDEALFWAEKSLEKAPDQVYALHLKAYSLLYLNRNDEAEQMFLEVLRKLRARRGIPQTGYDIEVPEQVVLNGLGEARKRLDKK